MSAWSPTWKVTIDSTEYNNVTLANLTVTSGRTDFYLPNQPSYAYFEIINLDTSAISIEIGQSVRLQVDGVGAYQSIFAGNVTDITIDVAKAGTNGLTQSIKVMALGTMQRLLNAYTDGVLSKDFDGNQVNTILASVEIGTWTGVPTADTWDTFDATKIWSDYGPYGTIDTPGDYELTSRSASYDTAYNIVTAIATSALGYLYEDLQGRINYADSTHRAEYLATNGYKNFSANKAIGTSISSQKRLGDVKNEVTITYKANATYTDSDDASIASYGRKGVNILTSLENGADATSQAAYYLDSRSTPKALLRSITFPLQNDELTDTERADLLGLFMGVPVRITDLPANMFNGEFEGFLEGYTYQASYNGLSMTLYISPLRFSTIADAWTDVSASLDWQSVNAILTWQNAEVVS